MFRHRYEAVRLGHEDDVAKSEILQKANGRGGAQNGDGAMLPGRNGRVVEEAGKDAERSEEALRNAHWKRESPFKCLLLVHPLQLCRIPDALPKTDKVVSTLAEKGAR